MDLRGFGLKGFGLVRVYCSGYKLRSLYLAVLEDEESHVPPVMDVVLPEERGSIVLDPHTSQLVVVNVVHLEPTLRHTKCACNSDTSQANFSERAKIFR